ncbi:MAG TPA: HEAT repeat domain-containing protein [Longimicrobiales bacterium]|nr:HEAT repeat domain-containing protein [Longimicrobiales bacterium]
MTSGPDLSNLNPGNPVPPEEPVPPEPVAPKPQPVAETPSDAAGDRLEASDVANLLIALDKAVRARRLYQSNNPVYHTFINGLRDAFVRLWERTNILTVGVEEHGFVWEEQLFRAVGEGRDNLPFLFYKDGIRYLTFLPMFEEEVERFLGVVHQARALDQNSDDDMVTLLWEREFAAFQYSFVDALSEGLVMPAAVALRQLEQVDPTAVASDVQRSPADAEAQPFAVEQGKPPVAASISRGDFEETLYFLEPAELEYLREEVEKEWQRDLKADVLNALFDRLEDRMPERQTEVLRILRQLLPAYLARGDLRSASTILTELNAILEAGDVLGPEQQQQTRELFDELSDPAVLTQLLRSLEQGAIDPTGAELGVFLRHLGSKALALLIRATETTEVEALQARLRIAVEHLARAHPDTLIELVASDDEIIAIGATRLAGQAALPSAGPAVASLLRRTSAPIRRAAVEALVQIKSGAALEALQVALDDPDRDVRVTSARGLAALKYQPARARLEAVLARGELRSADLTEKIAFFEALGAVGNADSVALLDKLLNGKNLLRQKQPPEIRACAAMALGRLGSPASRAALERATTETNPLVRSAVAKALRQEVAAS